VLPCAARPRDAGRDGASAAPLHDELVLLVKAGMTPMEALQAATRNAAEFLGTQRTEGTVEAGKRTNLVLLEASPLEDIANTRRIHAVLLAGRLLATARPAEAARLGWSMTDNGRELTAAIAAVSAGLRVARERIGAVRVTTKTGVDVVTDADVAAEDAIRTVLTAHCPEIDIVGEERGGDARSASYWLIDPICGTRN